MAVRPLVFGARLRHRDRTLRRDHLSLDGALRDLARTWRSRLN
jgi:hypothetical protein